MDFSKTKLIIYDFDGVMTDNTVHLDEHGTESVTVHRGDGLAISEFHKKNIEQMILSTEKNPVVSLRAKKLNLNVTQSCKDKGATVRELLTVKNLDPSQVVYIGNDINDLEAMLIVGLPICPSDAHIKIKEISKLVLSTPGGKGVVREFLDVFSKGGSI